MKFMEKNRFFQLKLDQSIKTKDKNHFTLIS